MQIKNFNLNISPGKKIGIVGATGSGKSTLVKLLLRLYKISKGSIEIDGKSIESLDLKSLRRCIALVSQETYLFQGTIEENISYGSQNVDKSKIKNAADIAEATEFINQLPEGLKTIVGERGQKLSGGQRQRISIARALATQPRLLVCDEPTSALDVSIQAQILNLLKDLQEQLNLTILFISHDLPVVRQMCDRIAVLKNGKLCEISNTEDLFIKPKHDYTKELLKLMPKIESIYK